MIRHCVFVRFRPDVSAGERAEILEGIAGLKSRVPGFLAAHIAPNTSPETGMDKGYSEGFIVDFADAAARDAYLIDPEHQRIGARLVGAAEGGVDGVLVYDMDVED